MTRKGSEKILGKANKQNKLKKVEKKANLDMYCIVFVFYYVNQKILALAFMSDFVKQVECALKKRRSR